jgi:hypothetical protein
LLTKQRIHPRFTLPHPLNRFGDILVGANVQPHILDIVDVGFSWSEVANAAAFDMPSDPKAVEVIESAVARVVEATGGRLAAVVPGQAKVLVCVCTHTTAGLHAVHVGARSDIDKLSNDGKLSIAKIRERDPDFGVAVDEGIEYHVIDRIVAETWPNFVKLVQEAGNATGGVAKGDTWMHNLLRVYNFAKDGSENNQHIDWDKVREQCLRSKPTHAHDIADMMRFVQQWSGGLADPTALNMIKVYLHHAPVLRVVRGWVFKARSSSNKHKQRKRKQHKQQRIVVSRRSNSSMV